MTFQKVLRFKDVSREEMMKNYRELTARYGMNNIILEDLKYDVEYNEYSFNILIKL